MTEARINARLDADTSRKLDALKRRTGLSTSEVVRVALQHLYAGGRIDHDGSAEAILTGSGFIGCAQGDENLSVNYKRAQAVSLRQKIG